METPETTPEAPETKRDNDEIEDNFSTDYGDKTPPPEIVEEPEEKQKEAPTKQGHSGKNILTGVKPSTPEEQREHVSKSKSTPKEPGRMTNMENELKRQRDKINELGTNITKMMFVIVVLSIGLFAFKMGAIVHTGADTENIIELIVALLLSFFGVNSTYKYTKEHPEKGDTGEQLVEATKDFVEGVTNFIMVSRKK